MYKMLIAEDESKFSDFIKNSIDWNDIDVESPIVCTNGEDALKYIFEIKPDVALIDMKMPRMDGLELIKRVREADIDVRIIVISGYNDFNTVKKAFKQGIADYILKAELNPDDIKESVKRIIEGKRSNDPVLKEKYLRELIWSSRKLTDKPEGLHLRIKNENLVILVLNILNYEDLIRENWKNESELFKDGLANMLEELLEEEKCGEAIIKQDSEVVFLFSFSEIGDINIKIEQTITHIVKTINKYLETKTAVGCAGVADDTTELMTLYENAKTAAEYTFVVGRDRIVFYQNEISRACEVLYDESLIENFENKISNYEFFQLLSEFENFIIKDASIHSFKKLISLYEVYFQIISRFASKYKKEEITDSNLYREILKTGTLSELNAYFYDVIRQLKDAFEEFGGVIFQVQKYVKKYYFKNITVEHLAEEFGVNYKKLSRMFVKQTGMGLKKYIIKIRMEETMRLITSTDYLLYEIAEMLGYSNYESFSRSFYNYFGKWPKEIDRELPGGETESWLTEKK